MIFSQFHYFPSVQEVKNESRSSPRARDKKVQVLFAKLF